MALKSLLIAFALIASAFPAWGDDLPTHASRCAPGRGLSLTGHLLDLAVHESLRPAIEASLQKGLKKRQLLGSKKEPVLLRIHLHCVSLPAPDRVLEFCDLLATVDETVRLQRLEGRSVVGTTFLFHTEVFFPGDQKTVLGVIDQVLDELETCRKTS